MALTRRGVLPPERAIEKLPWSAYARRLSASIHVAMASANACTESFTTSSPMRPSSGFTAISRHVPGAAVASHERVRLLRPPCARRVVRAVCPIGRMRAPAVEDCGAEPPCLLDLILTGEQRRVAEHAIEDESLICVGRLLAKRRAVREVHVHRLDAKR